MKEYLKNVAVYLVAAWVLFVSAGLLEIGLLVISVWGGLSMKTTCVFILAIAVILATAKTIRERRKRHQAAKIIPVLLEEAIMDQTANLAAIDTEPATAGKTRRRAKCRITVIALEEKRDRLINGKDRRGKRESRTNEHETEVVGENPGRRETPGN